MNRKIVFFSQGSEWSFPEGVVQALRERLCCFAHLEELVPFSSPLFSELVRLLHFLEAQKWTGLAYLTEEFLVPLVYSLVKDVWREQLEEEIARCQPKLLISCVPWINGLLAEIASRLRVPFVLIPHENELKNWLHGMQRKHVESVWLFINQYMPESFCEALRMGVLESQIFSVGAPIDPAFRVGTASKGLRQKKPPASQEKIVAISVTSLVVLRGYLEHLLSWEQRLQIIIFDVGGGFSDSLLEGEGGQIILAKESSWASWLSMCDLWIASPITTTLNHAIAAKIPVLVDEIGSVAWRDSVNAFFLQEKGLGAVIRSYEDLPFLLAAYLYDAEVKTKVQTVFEHLQDNRFWHQLDLFLEQVCTPLLPCS